MAEPTVAEYAPSVTAIIAAVFSGVTALAGVFMHTTQRTKNAGIEEHNVKIGERVAGLEAALLERREKRDRFEDTVIESIKEERRQRERFEGKVDSTHQVLFDEIKETKEMLAGKMEKLAEAIATKH